MENNQKKPLDLAAVRARLEGTSGPQYWRSLEELAETEEFRAFLEDEFPQQARTWGIHIDRRQFLTLMGASLGLAGLAGCRYLPQEKIVPYVKQPEELVFGKPLFYATALTLGGYAVGVLAKSREGRPIKIEGNPTHPDSLGTTDVWAQATILSMYDPDRSQDVINDGYISTYEEFMSAAKAALDAERTTGGAGLRILTETITSPTLAAQIQSLMAKFPKAQWHAYEPANRDNVRAGALLAFGEVVHPVYHFDKADVILTLDADFLLTMPGHVRYANDFGNRRRVRTKQISARQPNQTTMNRLYAVESSPTITGAMADHLLPVRAQEVEIYARALAEELGVTVGTSAGLVADRIDAESAKWIKGAAEELKKSGGKCVLVPGEHQPPIVHALAHAMNEKLGNVGSTVTYSEPVDVHPVDQMQSLRELVTAMNAKQVQTLVILGGNPAYTAPPDFHFAEAIKSVPNRFRLGEYEDESSALCNWHIPQAHLLETWSDARGAYDGTATVIQPLIAPLFGGKSPHDLLEMLQDQARSGYDIVTGYWQSRSAELIGNSGVSFDKFWEKTLNDGVVPNTEAKAKTVAVKPGFAAQAPVAPSAGSQAPVAPSAGGMEINFRLDPSLWDGRFANNGWLQELPKPLMKTTWDNVALMSFGTAEKLGLTNTDLVQLKYRGGTVTAPVWILPNHPDDAVSVHLGFGRTRSGKVGTDVGFNAGLLRTSDAPWFASGLEIVKTGAQRDVSTTQYQSTMEERDPVRATTLAEFLKEPDRLKKGEEAEESVNPPDSLDMYAEARHTDHKYEGPGAYAWGMSIDNSVCISCNACVVACQAENNIPVVGKEQVSRGRAMHWLRIDRYYTHDPRTSLTSPSFTRGDEKPLANTKQPLANAQTFFQPVLCMHCENAPCEPVCPVAATVHSHEGLNQMVYNRCIGTKYCSNNCPYKVRRFNFLCYANFQDIPLLKLAANPEVTVRGRGVMEKCTYCVQRINTARQQAKIEGRTIQDDEIVTACQQACPTNAIVFGDLSKNSPASTQVQLLKSEPHDYSLLAELDTRPRTTYLPKMHNPNEEMEPKAADRQEKKTE